MNQKRPQRRDLILATLALSALPCRIQAQSPIQVVLPFPPDAPSHRVVQVLVTALARELGEPAVLVNRGSVRGTAPGTEGVARSIPDGRTLLLAQPSHLLNQVVFPQIDYAPLGSFEPIALAASFPFVLAVAAQGPVRDLAGLVALLRAEPGQHGFGSPGPGTAAHLGARLLLEIAGAEAEHHPFAGLGAAMDALAEQRVLFVVTQPAGMLEPKRAAKLQAIAIAGPRRLSILPDVPTARESLVPGFEAYDVDNWMVLMAPAATPSTEIDRLAAAVERLICDPGVRGALEALGAEPRGGLDPRGVRRFLEEDSRRLLPLARRAMAQE